MRAALGLPDGVESLPPVELIRAVLLAPVDLLFNGGIGTYVKASTESALDAGDKANDAVRVDGRDLRARVVGEGGNLGLTQRGRIEYALSGGRVNTDAIDNSAGVDTSDHEVNIKIALNRVVDDGDARRRRPRRSCCGEMTDEVAAAGPQRQPRAERDAGRRGRARPAACSTRTSGCSARWSGRGGWCAASRRCPTSGRWSSAAATGRR